LERDQKGKSIVEKVKSILINTSRMIANSYLFYRIYSKSITGFLKKHWRK
jgi:hypothetical protein